MVSLFGGFSRKISIFQEKMKVLVTTYGRVYPVSKRMIFQLRRVEIKFVTYSLALSHWLTQSACATSCIIDPMGGTDPGLALVLQPYCVICVHMDRENTITHGEKVTEYYNG